MRIIYLLLLSVNLFASFQSYNNINIKSLFSVEDSLSPNKSIDELQFSTRSIKYKTPGKSLLLSGILPGLGQAYTGNWFRAMVFLGLDITALSTGIINNKKAEDKKKERDQYASNHWSFSRWVHDYYKWYEYRENDTEWNAIREVFINRSDSTSGCAQDPSSPQCYVDIWEHSHKVEFIYDGDLVSSNSSEFKIIFQELCGNNHTWDTFCSNEVMDDSSIYVIKDHHFFEGIQKYDMFFAGWDDNDSTIIITKSHGDKNATSPNQKLYRSLWNDYNEIKTLAGNSAKFMLFNRAISMVDALLLAKKWNKKYESKLSLNAYPDLTNRYGIGSLQLVLHLK